MVHIQAAGRRLPVSVRACALRWRKCVKCCTVPRYAPGYGWCGGEVTELRINWGTGAGWSSVSLCQDLDIAGLARCAGGSGRVSAEFAKSSITAFASYTSPEFASYSSPELAKSFRPKVASFSSPECASYSSPRIREVHQPQIRKLFQSRINEVLPSRMRRISKSRIGKLLQT